MNGEAVLSVGTMMMFLVEPVVVLVEKSEGDINVGGQVRRKDLSALSSSDGMSLLQSVEDCSIVGDVLSLGISPLRKSPDNNDSYFTSRCL